MKARRNRFEDSLPRPNPTKTFSYCRKFLFSIFLADSSGSLRRDLDSPKSEGLWLLRALSPLHGDASQSAGKTEVSVDSMNVSLLTIAGHKLYCPKGIGALYVRRGTNIDKFIHGARQEVGRRAGTENVPYIVGLGRACEIAFETVHDFGQNIKTLRERLHNNIIDNVGEERVKLNGHLERRLRNTLNISIKGVIGEELLGRVPQIAASTGSACHAGSTEPSPVLLAMDLTRTQALGALRLSLGRWSAEEEIDEASRIIARNVQPKNNN